MDKANLPLDSACEPNEEARQPLAGKKNSTMPDPNESKKSKNKNITFAESEKDEVCSQSSSSTYKDALSQPTAGMTHRQKLQWLQKRRSVGLWAQCDDCQRWRWLPGVLDRHELPDRWFCRNNPDSKMASCSIPEAPLPVREEEDLIHSEYSCGSLVWARLAGWPWWPAMVDDCPDTERFYWLDGFSDIPTYYNVVFFDAFDTTRAWVAPEAMKPFVENIETFRYVLKMKKYNKRLEVAMEQANDASNLAPEARLEKYSFIARFKGLIVTPKKINKNVLKVHQKKLERKYHISFPIENSEDDSEGHSCIREESKEKQSLKRNNLIILGTPKSKKPRMRQEKEKKETSRNVTIVGTPKSKALGAAVETPKKTENKVDDTPKSNARKAEENPSVASAVDGSPRGKGTKTGVETSDEPKVSIAAGTATKQPYKLSDIIEYSINNLQDSLLDTNSVSGTERIKLMESVPVTESTDAFKEPNSMAVQCGSTKTTTAISDSPQMENLTPLMGKVILESQNTSGPVTVDDSEYRGTLAHSPSSDDFEF